jgi:hypothetical protein
MEKDLKREGKKEGKGGTEGRREEIWRLKQKRGTGTQVQAQASAAAGSGGRGLTGGVAREVQER